MDSNIEREYVISKFKSHSLAMDNFSCDMYNGDFEITIISYIVGLTILTVGVKNEKNNKNY